MDFERAFGNGAGGRVFLKARIRCEEGGRFLWLLNSDDSAVVWLDGRRVISSMHTAPAEGFLARARVEMTPGEHTVVAGVSQSEFVDEHIYNGTQNYWLFRLRVRRDEHAPAPVVGLPWEGPQGPPPPAGVPESF